MSEFNRIRAEQYKNIVPIAPSQSRKTPFNKTIHIDFKPDYDLSENIAQHIRSTNNNIANKSIRFLNSSMNINTRQNTIGLELSFVINTQMLTNETEKSRNYKIMLQFNDLVYSQEDGLFTNTDDLLFKSINKLAKLMYDFTQNKQLEMVALHNNPGLVNTMLQDQSVPISQHLNDIIALIYAKGKFRGIKKHNHNYGTKPSDTIHIPRFNLLPGDLKIDLQIEEQIGTPVLTQNNEKVNPGLFVFQNWMLKTRMDWVEKIKKGKWYKRWVQSRKQNGFPQDQNNGGTVLLLVVLVILIILILLI